MTWINYVRDEYRGTEAVATVKDVYTDGNIRVMKEVKIENITTLIFGAPIYEVFVGDQSKDYTISGEWE